MQSATVKKTISVHLTQIYHMYTRLQIYKIEESLASDCTKSIGKAVNDKSMVAEITMIWALGKERGNSQAITVIWYTIMSRVVH